MTQTEYKLNIATLFSMLCRYGAAPTRDEFIEIIRDSSTRCKKYNALEYFLRDKTVKKYPIIDSLPMTELMKNTIIELPNECEDMLNIYESFPRGISDDFSKAAYNFIKDSKSFFKQITNDNQN